MEYIASLSYGKDSLYMLEIIHKLHLPIDRIIHAEIMATETIPADLPQMMDFKKKADKIIFEKYGIQVEHIEPAYSYEERFYKKRLTKRTKPEHYGNIRGFPLVIGAWCNSDLKMNVLGKFRKPHIIQYVGYAVDEKKKKRQEKIKAYQDGFGKCGFIYPLVDCKVTEKECFDWCKENDLLSPIYTTATRGGCWFCHNASLPNLFDLKTNHPELWGLMLKWDIDSPVKFRTDGTTIHDLDIRFEAGFVYKKDYMKFLKEYKKHLFVMRHKRGGLVPKLCGGTGLNNHRMTEE